MITGDDGLDNDQYYAMLGRMAESAGTLEHLIYLLGDLAFDLPNIRRLTAPPALDKIRAAAESGSPIVVPSNLDVADWTRSCAQVFEMRNVLIHVARVYDGTLGISGIRRTKFEASVTQPRSLEYVTAVWTACRAHSDATVKIFNALMAARSRQQPGWSPRQPSPNAG